MLGVFVTEEYKEAVKRSVNYRIMQKRKKKEAAESLDDEKNYPDGYSSFVVAYTSGGAAYGLCLEDTSFSEQSINRDDF